MNKILFILLATGVLLAAAGCGWWWYTHHNRLTWTSVNALIQRQFPEVKQMTVGQLRRWLDNPHQKQPMLLDVRANVEYQVSHLHHARWINSKQPVPRAMAGVSRRQPIVVYCSVGYRSSAYVQRLVKDGFTNVTDLRGSIFQWANAGLPVYRDGTIVHHVHPYDEHWGQLLNRSLWEFRPPATRPAG